MEKRIDEDIGILGRVSVNFQNVSARIYNLYEKHDEIQRQKNIPHLGLISQAFSGINHSRYEYVILQCVISELVENSFRGTSIAQGSIKIKGEEYLGNDILKSWFLLSNFGHCKNTIGDEKTLLLKAVKRKGFKTYLINCVKDEELKLWAERVIEDLDYVSFHHILSIRRIYKTLKRRLSLQNELINIYKLLLLDSSETAGLANELQTIQLKKIYRNVRDLAIISLDSRNSSLPITIDILSMVLSFDFFENKFQQNEAKDIFNPLLSLLCDNLYLHPLSQSYQRSYEVRAFDGLKETSYNLICNNALLNGLSTPNDCHLNHFIRISEHVDDMKDSLLKDNLRLALTIKRGVKNVEASLDFNPFTSSQVMDFYLHKSSFELSEFPRFLMNIIGILKSQRQTLLDRLVDEKKVIIKEINKSVKGLKLEKDDAKKVIKPLVDIVVDEAWDIFQTINVPHHKEILWAFLKFHLKENYYFDIDHHISKKYKFFGVKIEDEMDFLNSEINKAIKENTDPDRKHELKQLRKSTSRKYNGIIIACLSRITIFDYSKPPNKRKVTDIDSLVLKFNKNETLLEMHESKNTSNPTGKARKDLKTKLVKVLNKSCKGYSIRDVNGFGAKLVIKHSAIKQ
ncbi:MAG: hypothetical protein R8N23_16225 [Reichenbachiella sp.]|uniref:hypothetical protein n=1 Tax=Reichenbachiella sp. TaxID=2184521 RepID=UPI0029670F1C|nr:hypothetical protein [Reichenbachiella sp.]MDW3211418.1 hypothetical protein [Reichenbachiella sp.]